MKTGIEIIAEERTRQIEIEGWTSDNDDKYVDEQLAEAAASYALPNFCRKSPDRIPITWPFHNRWWKPTLENRIKELAKAGALIAAEIDRIQRTTKQPFQN